MYVLELLRSYDWTSNIFACDPNSTVKEAYTRLYIRLALVYSTCKILFDVSFASNRLPRMVSVGKRRICAKYEVVRLRGKRAPGAPNAKLHLRKCTKSSIIFQVIDYIEKHVGLYEKGRRLRQGASFIFCYFLSFFFLFDARKKERKKWERKPARNGKITFLISKTKTSPNRILFSRSIKAKSNV